MPIAGTTANTNETPTLRRCVKGHPDRLPAELLDPICDLSRRWRVFAETERVEQLVNEGSLDFFGVSLRRVGERATAHINHAASHGRKREHALVAASGVPFAVLDYDGTQVTTRTRIRVPSGPPLAT